MRGTDIPPEFGGRHVCMHVEPWERDVLLQPRPSRTLVVWAGTATGLAPSNLVLERGGHCIGVDVSVQRHVCRTNVFVCQDQ